MSKREWYAKGVYILFALALTISLAGGAAPVGVAAAEPEEVNTLRVYGQCTHDSEFPYDDEDDPFNLDNDGLTDKDFLVWNPAYMNHWDIASNGLYGLFFQKIVVNSKDANEKVFLKQWYVPKYQEPKGCVWVDLADADYAESPDIVKEYTYLLLDTSNNPVAGLPTPELTTFVFPIADNDDDQIGLDSYDAVVDDGVLANITRLNYVWVEPDPYAQNDCPSWCTNGDKIDISTQKLTLFEGDVIQFLDHSAEVMSLANGSVLLKVYYGGNDEDDDIAYPVLVRNGEVLSAGRHAVHVDNLDFADPTTWDYLRPVVEPWYLKLDTATVSGGAKVWAGRLLQEGETFFVDAAEYDVASLWIEGGGLKYITLRNPLPKVEVDIAPLTITKKAVGPCPELIPLLPPFNMEHDIIDDVNIPENVAGNPNDSSEADVQNDDNVIGEVDTTPSDGYGDTSGIDMDYNTIAERWVDDQAPAEECWVEEDKEDRFDTNLLEEKFTGVNETWQWINIETLPWEYTEFVLPEIDDITDPVDNDDGDFILVSSFLAPNSGTGVRVKFYFDAALGIVNSADIYVNDADYNDQYFDIDANSLRVYGQCDKTGAFPYLGETDPFDLTGANITQKDFLVWNPAYMYHQDRASNGEFGRFFKRIVVNGNDANEKVFLKQWYVPKYEEPTGCVWVCDVTGQYEAPDIVKEYTYLLLDTDNNPVLGLPKPELTKFVFPIADKDDAQIGLDSYDAVAGDGIPANETVLNRIWVNQANVTARLPSCCTPSPVEVIDISTDDLVLGVGDFIEFLDHSAAIIGIHDGYIDVQIWYGGNDADAEIGDEMTVDTNDLLSAGRHHVHVEDAFDWTNPALWTYLAPVTEPWYLEVVDATEGGDALVRVGRLMLEGESFFVDAAEYAVASLWLEQVGGEWALKYITLRNPLPKEEVDITPLTIIKKAVEECPELIPLLPPFNMEHDIIDDINIPEKIAGDPNKASEADWQFPDNDITEGAHASPYSDYGVNSHIDLDYNTIWERRVEDQDPAEECWFREEKEPRFDTNLMEEKFTAVNETWQWINIETLPWEYTEFVLPEIDDIVGSGDFILVSSFLAPNSANAMATDVRVKFVYDAIDGTGIYVNTRFIPECELQGDVNGDGSVNSGDITKLERIILTLDAETVCADVNGDGNINAGDITWIELIMLGLV